MIEKCVNADFDEAYKIMNHLWRLGLLLLISFYSIDSFFPFIFRLYS